MMANMLVHIFGEGGGRYGIVGITLLFYYYAFFSDIL